MINNLIRFLLIFVVFLQPVVGYCNPFSGVFKKPKDVAAKVAELPEQYKITVRGLDFSPDGKHLAVVSADEKINIWDWQTGHIVRTVKKIQGANDASATAPIRYSPDGRLFVSCSDTVTRIWNAETWAVTHDIVDLQYRGCNAIGFTPDGKSLVQIIGMMGSGNNLTVYDTTLWQPVWSLRTIPFYPWALSISPDGKHVAIGGHVIDGGPETDKIIIVDLAQRVIVRTIQNTVSFENGHLSWSPDGVQITAIGRRGWDGSRGVYTSGLDTAMVFDAQSGKQIAGEQFDDADAAKTFQDIEGASAQYTLDGKYLIEGFWNGRGSGRGVRIWDAQHRQLLQEIHGEVSGLAVSRDGHYFAMGEVGKTIVWQLK